MHAHGNERISVGDDLLLHIAKNEDEVNNFIPRGLLLAQLPGVLDLGRRAARGSLPLLLVPSTPPRDVIQIG